MKYLFLLLLCGCTTFKPSDHNIVSSADIKFVLGQMGIKNVDIGEDRAYYQIPDKVIEWPPVVPYKKEGNDCDEIAITGMTWVLEKFRKLDHSAAIFRIKERLPDGLYHEANIYFGTDNYLHYVDFQTHHIYLLKEFMDGSTTIPIEVIR